ncbi:MAG: site-specific integrase [Bacteroidetes bacterium]|nr:site-specific integrase [Bacteroidota bacterium]
MSVTIREIENKDFTTSMYLDIYHNGKRYKEFLKECKLVKICTPADRVANKAKRQLANQIRDKRSIQLQSNDEGVIANHQSKIELQAYFENYIQRYTKKDKRNVEGVYNKFLEFAKIEGYKITTLKNLDERTIEAFADYLQHVCTGEGASSYFARFKKVLKQAVKEKIILQSPASEITIVRDESLKRSPNNSGYSKKLANTEITNQVIKKAFLFSCFTGLRWVDIKDLQWKHIDLESEVLNKVQAKTDVKVSVTLNNNALSLLPEKGEKNEFVFALPSHTGALKTLKLWLKKADIDKHITWHCARHSFATNLIVYDTDVLIVSKLLGHNTLKYTQRYTHVANDLKKKATDSLPTINF